MLVTCGWQGGVECFLPGHVAYPVSRICVWSAAVAIGNDPRATTYGTKPELAFVPIIQLKFKGLLVMIGQRSVSVSNPAPYLGWVEFKSVIVEVFNVLLQSQQVSKIDRYSIKYVNVLKTDGVPNSSDALDWSIRIGQLGLNKQSTNVRTETVSNGLLTIITLGGGVTVQVLGQTPIQGALIDIDTICQTEADPEDFMARMSSELDRIRHANKVAFFECLTNEAIRELDPTYE
ncbi:TIGR04255 family protein [Candidimonas nitroreducens]|uniref:TIGR04255 family protein n=1 Tax=Candidimonas nitroreducens TaxID=683354 RepID=A0A225MYT4_9BURK|nr:TIGR04255 family protein [Candidimonas nitroreducens]OWT63849.1 hypothetical protein CEY11_05955 [Candidimonas nitroreducens]